MTNCDHISKVTKWGIKRDGGTIVEIPVEYGCTKCDVTSETPLSDGMPALNIDHSDCDNNPCFGCKAKGLQLNTGDANHTKMVSNKKWNSELNAYEQARAEGIQPAGTSMAKILEARKASEAMGKAFNADTAGVEAGLINNKTADKLKEVGLV